MILTKSFIGLPKKAAGRRSPVLQQLAVVVVRRKTLAHEACVAEEGLMSKLTEYLAGSSSMVPTRLLAVSVKVVE
jgi:hypothetical protein